LGEGRVRVLDRVENSDRVVGGSRQGAKTPRKAKKLSADFTDYPETEKQAAESRRSVPPGAALLPMGEVA
jgi:hypothetical protein